MVVCENWKYHGYYIHDVENRRVRRGEILVSRDNTFTSRLRDVLLILRCSLFVTRRLLRAVCYALFVTRCLLRAVCYALFVTRCLLRAVCYALFVARAFADYSHLSFNKKQEM
jgi:hypothetical protein